MAPVRNANAPAARPLRRDAERNRQRILEAAAEVFAERGLDATLDDIAAHAGVGVGTVYRRFADKDVLVEALFVDRMNQVVAMAEEAARLPDPWQSVVAILEGSAAQQAVDRGLRELVASVPRTQTQVAAVRDRLLPCAERVFARAQAAGVLRADLRATDMALFVLMLGAVSDHTQGISDESWRRYCGILLDGIAERREAPTPLPAPALDADVVDQVMSGRGSPRRRGTAH